MARFNSNHLACIPPIWYAGQMKHVTQSNSETCLIGFGEAGTALAHGFAGIQLTAYDIQIDATEAVMRTAMQAHNVRASDCLADALSAAHVIFSVVTADQALTVATAAAPHILPGALFFDCNSCAPSTKLAASEIIEAAGGRYVDVAIMAPIESAHHQTPMLVASPHADDALAKMHALDMKVTKVGSTVGRASTIKMLRSVMIKGIEALTAECFRAACRAGVADDVAASLDASQTTMGWADQAAYNLERMTTHGVRRAAEMREVAKTLQDLGIDSNMTNGTIDWQAAYGAMGIDVTAMTGLHQRVAAIEEHDSLTNDQ